MSQPQLLLLCALWVFTLQSTNHPTAYNCLVTPPTPQVPQSSYRFSSPFFNPNGQETDMMLSNKGGSLARFLPRTLPVLRLFLPYNRQEQDA